MNISFIDYNKKVENLDNLDKKITKYKQKIEDILNSYEERPSNLDELEERDKALYKKYIEVIRKYEKSKTVAQEKARAMAEAGKFPLSRSKKIALGLAAALIVGGGGYAYLNSNQLNLGQSNDKNDTPANNTDSLGQPKNDTMISNNNQNPNIDEPSLDDSTSSEVEYVDGQTPSVSDNNETTNGETNDEPQLPNSYNEPTEKVESLYETVLTDINNDEQVYARAKEIVELYDEFAPQYMVDVEYAAEMLRYINGGVVNEVSREAALDVIKTFEVLMNNEYLYAKEIRNKGVTGREESVKTIDYAIFFKDNTRAQKLATKVTSYRSPIIKEPLGDTKEYEQGFTTLLMNSWYNQGYQEISTYALETSGMSAVIDKLFLNTADVIRADQSDTFNITVHEPIDDKDITLSKMIDKVNEANCLAEMTADNGETFEMYVNKFTYDMEGMLKEAVYNKQAYDENFGRKLK